MSENRLAMRLFKEELLNWRELKKLECGAVS